MGNYVRETLYYEEHPESPDRTLEAIFKRAEETGIRYLVTASASGGTALRASELAKERGLGIQIVCVANPIGWTGPGINVMKEKN